MSRHNVHSELEMINRKRRKWELVEMDDGGSYVTVVRRFSGRMTELRWKIIDRYCRKNSWHQSCGHEWDCCGCCFAERFEFEYKHNQVSVFKTSSFNY